MRIAPIIDAAAKGAFIGLIMQVMINVALGYSWDHLPWLIATSVVLMSAACGFGRVWFLRSAR